MDDPNRHYCPDDGMELESLVLSYTSPDNELSEEVQITIAYEPFAPDYWFYICPTCHRVFCYRVEDSQD